jgi:hypothetical protein
MFPIYLKFRLNLGEKITFQIWASEPVLSSIATAAAAILIIENCCYYGLIIAIIRNGSIIDPTIGSNEIAINPLFLHSNGDQI